MKGRDEPVVFVVDDDAAARHAIENLLHSVDLRVGDFRFRVRISAAWRFRQASCLVLDVRLPGMSGIELQRHMTSVGMNIPIIFITGHGDIPMSVEAMKAGAMEFLTKPFRGQEFWMQSIRTRTQPRDTTGQRPARRVAVTGGGADAPRAGSDASRDRRAT